jgi:quercetin dioxygenase-like cupin family protein
VLQRDVQEDQFDWGDVGWRCVPALTGSNHLVVLDVTLTPGNGHDFHRHPDQEEMIIVKAGRIEHWIEGDSQPLGPGDSVYIDADMVHASFNTGDEDAHLQVFLGPSVGDGGYELVDVSGEEPWISLRA